MQTWNLNSNRYSHFRMEWTWEWWQWRSTSHSSDLQNWSLTPRYCFVFNFLRRKELMYSQPFKKKKKNIVRMAVSGDYFRSDWPACLPACKNRHLKSWLYLFVYLFICLFIYFYLDLKVNFCHQNFFFLFLFFFNDSGGVAKVSGHHDWSCVFCRHYITILSIPPTTNVIVLTRVASTDFIAVVIVLCFTFSLVRTSCMIVLFFLFLHLFFLFFFFFFFLFFFFFYFFFLLLLLSLLVVVVVAVVGLPVT